MGNRVKSSLARVAWVVNGVLSANLTTTILTISSAASRLNGNMRYRTYSGPKKAKKKTFSFSKYSTHILTAKGNIRDSGLIGVSDNELSRRYKDKNISKKEKIRIKKEQKARQTRKSRKGK